ncbi:hypothetical protein BV20DRAFT_188702 [Pilatotrama ljubarskyi]|nr:hypothetical protein BV20DRAFT_188702 [Pilatotrama ljubarskyi]
MDSGPMSIHAYASLPAEIFNPYDSPKTALAPLNASVDSRDVTFASFPAAVPIAPSHKAPAISPVTACRDAPSPCSPSQNRPLPPLPHAAPIAPAADANASDHEGGKAMHAQQSLSPAPPPVPPKSPTHDRPKSVSILVPTDISPATRIFSHSKSDVGHSYRSTVTGAATSPEDAPVPGGILTSPQVSATAFADDTSSTSKAPHVRLSMEPATRKASSLRHRRNKLHKARQHSSPSLPLGSSLFGSLLSRAFGTHDSSRSQSRSSSSPSMSNRSYRPTRSVSDGGLVGTKRPPPSSRSSDTTDSSCTTSSSGSTWLSSASTALTTPESISPSLSPRNSTKSGGTNKLHKRRPPLAPSAAYQYPPGARASALGRSKSTPDGLGQRALRSREWSSVEEARHAAEEAEPEEYGPDPTSWYTSVSFLARCALSPRVLTCTLCYASPITSHLLLEHLACAVSIMTSPGNVASVVDRPFTFTAVDVGSDLRGPEKGLIACARRTCLHWLVLDLRRSSVLATCS